MLATVQPKGRSSRPLSPAGLPPAGLRPAVGPLTIVVGAPGSGRLDLVNREANDGDRIIDRRHICRALGGRLYEPKLDALVDRRRLTMLRELSTVKVPTWLVLEPSEAAALSAWTAALMPRSVIRTRATLARCLDRIERDPLRPAEQKRIDAAAARAYFGRLA